MKKLLLLIFSMVVVFSLSGCSLFRYALTQGVEADRPSHTTITVYDQEHNKVFETSDASVIAQFEERLFPTEEVEKEVSELPADAEKLYEILYLVEDKDRVGLGEGSETRFVLYKNYDYLSMLDLPMVGTETNELPKEVIDWLRSPENWKAS